MNASTSPDSPGAILDWLRGRPECSDRERDDAVERIASKFDADAVVEAVSKRFHDLGGPDAEVLLRLAEANPRPNLLRALGNALAAQPDLPPERAWDALAVLDGAGVLDDFPALRELFEELNECFGDDLSVQELAEQIEDDPDGLWLALQGLGPVEPDVRAEIIAGLAVGAEPMGPGLSEFLRLLTYADDPATRAAALAALAADREPSGAHGAWLDLANHHPDRDVSALAQQRLGRSAPTGGDPRPGLLARRDHPKLERALVTAINGRGRGTIVLAAVVAGKRSTAVFGCDVSRGIREVFGDVSHNAKAAEGAFRDLTGHLRGDVVENDQPLALGLLAGCLTLRSPETPPALRYWVEATAGPDLRAAPFPAGLPGWEPSELPFEEVARRSAEVLDACPDWIDESPLTYELAEEIALREGESPADPRRDAGAYRFLFERRLRGQLEHYRRMLLWMAGCWRSAGVDEFARSALGLAWQLAEAQHVVPGHPFAVALTTRSLSAARANLKRGLDPRKSSRPSE